MNYILEFPSDSKIWGPGVWWTIHVTALNADTVEKMKKYMEYINLILPKLPCDTCREHATTYLSQNPIEKYMHIKDDEGNNTGMFKWSWVFHNAVNARLEKQIVDYYTATQFYLDSEVCTLSCGN